jgi:hypothetical protein
LRLIDDLLHESGEDFWSEGIGHREANGDGCSQ